MGSLGTLKAGVRVRTNPRHRSGLRGAGDREAVAAMREGRDGTQLYSVKGDFTCQLGWAMVLRYLVKCQSRCRWKGVCQISLSL